MRVVFIGTGEIGLPVVRWLTENGEHQLVGVVTQPDKPVGRDQQIQPPSIKAALRHASIPVLQPARIKQPDAVAEIARLAPDLVVVMAYGQILPRAVLEIPPIACLNLHASLLPRHRGAAPIQAAIAEGDNETGITVMYMDEGLDTGDILLQSRIRIAANETGQSLHDRLAKVAPAALGEAVELLSTGSAPRIPQDSAKASYAPKLERDDGRINWREEAVVIERKIRAYDPWPGAHAILEDTAGKLRKLKIFSANITETATTPGELKSSPENGIMIGATGGALRLGEVQLEGRRRMTATDLLRGNPWIAQTVAA